MRALPPARATRPSPRAALPVASQPLASAPRASLPQDEGLLRLSAQLGKSLPQLLDKYGVQPEQLRAVLQLFAQLRLDSAQARHACNGAVTALQRRCNGPVTAL